MGDTQADLPVPAGVNDVKGCEDKSGEGHVRPIHESGVKRLL